MPILSSESALQSQLTMSLSPTRLTARELPYSPTESICIIFKEIDSISNVMKRESEFATKIANNKAKTTNSIRTVSALAITLTTLLMLSLPALGVVSVWADNFFGTSGPDTIVGTENDDKTFGREGNDNLSGEGGDDYIAGNAGNDEIHDGLGSDRIRAGSGHDLIVLEGVSQGEVVEVGTDEVHGGRGNDNINGDSSSEGSVLLIYGDSGGDTITTGHETNGRIYGGSGGDVIEAQGDSNYDVWGGPGNDEIGGSSECSLDNVFGGSGNDEIFQANELTRGGLGNDIIIFADCGGVAYGERGDDEIRGGDARVELHGGSGDDMVVGSDGGDDHLFGNEDNDRLSGRAGADSFSCGPGADTITDFNAAEGDTKTADCENVLEESVSVLDNNDNNANTTDTATTSSTPSSGVGEDSSATEEEEDASSLPTTATSSSNNSTETTEATGTAEIQKTMEVLPDEEPPADGQEAEPPTNDIGGQ